MIFRDRFHAGELLARRLSGYKLKNGIVLAIPRGGIVIGYVIAKELGLPLEPVLVKKIGHPLEPEYAIGAVGLEDEFYQLPPDVPEEYVRGEIEKLRPILRERQKLFLGGRKPANLEGKIVILADDGVATGSTILAALLLIRRGNPAKIVIAVPVGSYLAIQSLQEKADEIVCLHMPEVFLAIGDFYHEFYPVGDEEVIKLLKVSRYISSAG